MNCQIEFVSSDSDNGMPGGKPTVTRCSDCGAAICSDCQMDCRGFVLRTLQRLPCHVFLREEAS